MPKAGKSIPEPITSQAAQGLVGGLGRLLGAEVLWWDFSDIASGDRVSEDAVVKRLSGFQIKPLAT